VTVYIRSCLLTTTEILNTQTCTHTHTYRFFITLQGSRKLHFATCWPLQLPTTSQHHSCVQILPRNPTNIRIHGHTTPTHTSPTRTCTL